MDIENRIRDPRERFWTLHGLLIITWWCSDINNPPESVYCGCVSNRTLYSICRPHKHNHGYKSKTLLNIYTTETSIITLPWLCPKWRYHIHYYIDLKNMSDVSVSSAASCGHVSNHTWLTTIYTIYKAHKHHHKHLAISLLWTWPKPSTHFTHFIGLIKSLASVSSTVHCGYVPNHALYTGSRNNKHCFSITLSWVCPKPLTLFTTETISEVFYHHHHPTFGMSQTKHYIHHVEHTKSLINISPLCVHSGHVPNQAIYSLIYRTSKHHMFHHHQSTSDSFIICPFWTCPKPHPTQDIGHINTNIQSHYQHSIVDVSQITLPIHDTGHMNIKCLISPLWTCPKLHASLTIKVP